MSQFAYNFIIDACAMALLGILLGRIVEKIRG